MIKLCTNIFHFTGFQFFSMAIAERESILTNKCAITILDFML